MSIKNFFNLLISKKSFDFKIHKEIKKQNKFFKKLNRQESLGAFLNKNAKINAKGDIDFDINKIAFMRTKDFLTNNF